MAKISTSYKIFQGEDKMKSVAFKVLFCVVLMAGIGVFLSGCLPGAKTDSGSSAVIQTVSGTSLTSARAYVGSAQCQQCHPSEYSQWHESWHRKIVQPLSAGYIASGTIPEATYLYDATGAKGSTVPYTDWTTLAGGAGSWYTHGGRWKQRYLKKIDGLSYTDWYVSGAQWDTLDGKWAGASAGHWTSWKRHCNWCHNAGVDTTNLYSDKVEIGVGCEACHGAGSAHIAAATNEERRQTIINPTKLSKQAQAAVCGQCHNRGKTSSKYSDGETTSFPINYKLGDEAISDWNVDASGYWNSKETDLSKRVPTKHRMQYPDLMNSKHFGVTSCTDCHRGHNFRIENLTDNNLCTRCHSDYAVTEKLVAHAKHSYSTSNATLKSQLLCITCHMVKTAKSAIAYDQAGHTFRKFTPATESASKAGSYSPSTCSQSKLGCHSSETTANLSAAAFETPVSGSLIDRWKKATAFGKTIVYQ